MSLKEHVTDYREPSAGPGRRCSTDYSITMHGDLGAPRQLPISSDKQHPTLLGVGELGSSFWPSQPQDSLGGGNPIFKKIKILYVAFLIEFLSVLNM